ncbi:MAG: SGNH family hydrolase [Pseudomonadota bacterium]
MRNPILKFLAVFLVIAVSAPHVPVIKHGFSVGSAMAQQRKRKTLFDILFDRRKVKRQRVSDRNRQNLRDLPGVRTLKPAKKTKKRKQNTRQQRRQAAKPKILIAKNENAPKLLVVGDFIASGLSYGLAQLYAENPNLVVVERTQANSGIVRNDVRNWPGEITELIDEIKPVAILVLVGMNDRQAMRIDGQSTEKLSESWVAEYKKRIKSLSRETINKKVPLVWMGLPPVKLGAMNTDYLAFNEMYRAEMEATNGTFVDVWDGFTNAEGKFVSAGPDVNGQIVRLRGGKGINMTRAGKAKLAFFADKALRKLGVVGGTEEFNYASLGTVNVGNAQPNIPEYDPAKSGKTAVISLASPALDGGLVLEGEKQDEKVEQSTASVSYELVERGRAEQPQEGRIDAGWGLPAQLPKISDEAEKKDNPDKKPDEAAAAINSTTSVTSTN